MKTNSNGCFFCCCRFEGGWWRQRQKKGPRQLITEAAEYFFSITWISIKSKNTLPRGIFSVSSCPFVPRAMKINSSPRVLNILNEAIILWLSNEFSFLLLAPQILLLFTFPFTTEMRILRSNFLIVVDYDITTEHICTIHIIFIIILFLLFSELILNAYQLHWVT